MKTFERAAIGFVVALVVPLVIVMLLLFITSNPEGGMTTGVYVILSLALVVLGFGYYLLRKHAPKRLLGVVSILAALASNWYQLTKISTDVNAIDRLFFLGAGIAVLAQGFKEVAGEGED